MPLEFRGKVDLCVPGVISPTRSIEVPAEKVEELLATASPDQRRALERIIYERRILASSHRGPLPPPEVLEAYCRLIPDGGNRIMIRHEKQAEHRMRMEESTIKAQLEQSSAGQWMGLALGLFGLGGK